MVDIDDLWNLLDDGVVELKSDDFQLVVKHILKINVELSEPFEEDRNGKLYVLQNSEDAGNIYFAGWLQEDKYARGYFIQPKSECFEYKFPFKYIECRVGPLMPKNGQLQFENFRKVRDGGHFQLKTLDGTEGYFQWDCDGEDKPIWLIKSLSGVEAVKLPFLNWKENPFEPKQQDLGFEGLESLFG